MEQRSLALLLISSGKMAMRKIGSIWLSLIEPRSDGTHKAMEHMKHNFWYAILRIKTGNLLMLRLDHPNPPSVYRKHARRQRICIFRSLCSASNKAVLLENVFTPSCFQSFQLTMILLSVGRRDDVIIHTSGEKTVPGPMEDILMSSP
jgi:hypothetical protein